MRVREIIQACGADTIKIIDKNADYMISTDTRTISNGDIYLPLKGANFDGEDFIEQALKKGATGYFTTQERIFDNANTILKVQDTTQTYLELAGFQRRKTNPIVVGITGSCGKTTTKEMVYSVLSQKFKTTKTFSNHNNEIGFCQTVFNMEPDTEVLIVEMGMRGLGEIDLIAKYAKPNIAIITNSGSAHLGRLKTLENIAKAKCEISNYLDTNGVFIAKNQEIIKNTVNFTGEKIYFSIDDVNILEQRESYSKFIYKGREYELNVDGEYNIENSLAAIETGYKTGLTYDEIHKGLLEYKSIEKRWEVVETDKYKIINDSYNANPDSMKVSVKTFAQLYKNPVAILGDMGELGDNSAQLHREVGKYLSDLKNVKFLTVGKFAREIAEVLENNGIWVKSFDNNKDVSCYILANFDISNTMFLKASRAMKFEEIIEYMKRGTL